MKRGRKLGKTSLEIMAKLLEATVDVTTAYFEAFQRPGILAKKMYNLERGGYVKVKKDKNNQSFFHLTPRGKLAVLKYLHLEKVRSRKWDGHWRVIIFDIPESLKKWRNYLRAELKNLGFHCLQESVYITPFPVTGDLDEVLKEWGMRKHFRYLTVSEIDGEVHLKKFFNL